VVPGFSHPTAAPSSIGADLGAGTVLPSSEIFSLSSRNFYQETNKFLAQ